MPSPAAGRAGSSSELDGVSCVSATACTAAGQYYNPNSGAGSRTLVESWNGTAWSVVPTPNAGPYDDANYLSDVSCVSAAACTAAGDYKVTHSPLETLIESN